MKITKIYWGLLALVCVAGLAIAVYSTSFYSYNVTDITNGIIGHVQKNTNAKGTARAKASPTTNVTGIVRSVDNGSITISTISPDPAVIEAPATRVILISPDTKFIAVVAKSAAQIKTDLKKYQSDQKKGEAVAPPPPMNEISVDPTDIKLTMVITAFADNDISSASSFNASKISYQTF